MVKRDPNAHQSNHYKSTHNSGGKGNKKSGGKAGKGNKSINKFLGIGKPGPHLLKHKKKLEAKKLKSKKGSSDKDKSAGNNNSSDRHLFGTENVSTFVNRNILRNNNKKKALRQRTQNNNNNNTNNYATTSTYYNNNIISNMNNPGEEMTFTIPTWDASGAAVVLAPPPLPPISHVDTSNDDEYEKDINYQYQSAPTDSQNQAAPTDSQNQAPPTQEELERYQRKKAKKLRKKDRKRELKRHRKEEARVQALAQTPGPQYAGTNHSHLVSAAKTADTPIDSPDTSTADSDEDDDEEDAKDEMQRGDDFIGFGDDDSEDELAAVTSSKTPAEPSHAGQKRKRDPDYGSDAEGATGPPPGCPWMGHRQYSKLPSVPIMLTQELKDFVDYLSPTPEEHQVRKYVIQWIAKTVTELWPESEVHVFGSYDTRLYLPSSDLDLVVLRAEEFNKEDLYSLSRHLKKKLVATEISVIAKARVPIIKFKERLSKIPVDISFNITNGIESAEIVRNYMDTTPALRPLTMLIKHFLMIKGHNEVFQGGIGSYTTMIMILSFLQMHPQIQANKINPEDNIGVLLIEFFELYGFCFNYSQVGLSVANGGSYFIKPPNTGFGGNRELLLSSIDPNDPANDTAKGSYMLRIIREVFVGAYGTLTKNVQQRHRDLFGRDAGQRSAHHRFDDHNRVPADSIGKSSALHHQTQVSLIKNVLTIPQHVMEGRQHLEKVFYSGYFQDLFDDARGARGLTN
ncbi:hypothetical protein BGW39_010092 [Mortierella sp. 14UC]|nr:hypothetical protein BGW39_010092 [Mortierella sp. 14UC]